MVSYGPIVAEHVNNPRNLGKIDNADGVGTVDDPSTDTLITLYLKLAPGPDDRPIVAEARFRALGCSGCIATGSIATELVTGRPLGEALAVDAVAINQALENGLLPEQRYCADLAATALRRAAEAATP
jgi:nitrogen fixation NifU-like protein